MGGPGNFTLPKIFEVVLKSLAYNVTHPYLKGSKHYKFTVNLVSIALDELGQRKVSSCNNFPECCINAADGSWMNYSSTKRNLCALFVFTNDLCMCTNTH
jgi:hypothetical protein